MKKSTKIVSVILSIVMVLSVIPMTASAAAINSKYDTLEKLIQMDSLTALLDYLVNQINKNKDTLLTPVLRIVYLAVNNDQINKYIGDKEVSTMSGKEASQVLVKWLDTDILPPLNEKVQSNSAISTVTSLGVSVDLHSVQAVFDTLAQLDTNLVVKALRSTLLGDAGDLNVTAVTNKTVAGHEDEAVKAVIQFLKDNMSIIKKALSGNISLGLVDNFVNVNEYISFIGQLPQLLKSYIYKLIDKNAAAGEFEDGKMGGDWAKSNDYKSFTADQLLAAALVKAINQTDAVVSKSDADSVLKDSFYSLLAKYAPVLFSKYVVSFLNDNVQGWIDAIPAPDRSKFVAKVPTIDENTFADIFKNAASTGIFAQLNNIVVKAAQTVLTSGTFSALALATGDNANLNENLTKIARFALPILVNNEGALGISIPAAVKAADPATMDLTEIAAAILQAFFPKFFNGSANYNQSAVDAASSLPALAVLAANYAAAKPEWVGSAYTAGNVTADEVKDISEEDATAKTLADLAGIAIGGVKHNKDKLHFTVTSLDSDWEKAFNQIVNWGLDVISGFPAVARVHNLKNQNSYGPFYKLNVVLNELIDFSFLRNVSDATFKMSLDTLLEDGLLGNLYKGDIAAIAGIFEKNSNSGNILNGKIGSSVIGIVNRILTALFEHSCGTHGSALLKEDDPAAPCTKEIQQKYDYCKVCGAYFSYSKTSVAKKTPTHVYGAPVQISAATCTAPAKVESACTVCGATKQESSGSTLPHTPGTAVKEKEKAPSCTAEGSYDEVVYCTVCSKELSRTQKTVAMIAHNPGAAVKENEIAATCSAAGSFDEATYCTVCNAELTREKKTVALNPDAHAWGEWTTMNYSQHQRVCANDASHVETAPHEWDEGTVTRKPTTEKAGEKLLKCTVCGETKKETIEKLPATEITVKDDATGVSATYSDGTFSGAADLKVTKAAAAPALPANYASVTAYDISFQPKTKVTVRIPIPEGYSANDIKVFQVTENSAEEISAKVNNGQAVITTSKLGTFAIADGSTEQAAVDFKLGDVNGDGKITAKDARFALRKAVGLESYAPESREFKACDINKDGKVTASDARKILRAAVGLETF